MDKICGVLDWGSTVAAALIFEFVSVPARVLC